MDSAESSDDVSEEEVGNEAYVYPISAGNVDQKFVGDMPEHDGLECEQGGCKSKERVKSLHGPHCRIINSRTTLRYSSKGTGNVYL